MDTFEQLRRTIQDAVRIVENDIRALQNLSNAISTQIQQSYFNIFNNKKKNSLEELKSLENELRLTRIDLQEDISMLTEIISRPDHPGRNKRVEERLSRHIDYTKQVHNSSLALIKKLGGKHISTEVSGVKEVVFPINPRKDSVEAEEEVQIRFLEEVPKKVKDEEEVKITLIGEPVEDSDELKEEIREDNIPEAKLVDSAKEPVKIEEPRIRESGEDEYIKFLLEYGEKRAEKGDKFGYKEAIKIFKDALRYAPSHSEIFKNILSKIEHTYDAILKLPGNEDNPGVLFEKGEFLFEYGCFDKAAAVFQKTSEYPEWRIKSREMLRRCLEVLEK